ncbi:ATP-dependent DNA ligase [Paenibacillus sp. CAU 1782]
MFEKPMLPFKREAPFDSEDHLFEPKIAGQRLRLSMKDGVTTLLSRHGYDLTMQYPELLRVPLVTPADVVIDGEVTYLDPETGREDMDKLQSRYRMTRRSDIRDAAKDLPVTYFVFDLISLNGADLRSWPLIERKKALHSILEENNYFKHMRYVEEEGVKLYRLAGLLGLEGIMCKKKQSQYREGRSQDWLAVTNTKGRIPL